MFARRAGFQTAHGFPWGEAGVAPAHNSLRVKLLYAFLSLATTAAYASCPGEGGEPLPPRDALPAVERQLAQAAPACHANAGYLAYHGAVLNAMGRPAEGAALLEQALLLDPQRAGAELDYAESLAALGDNVAASSLLRQLIERRDVPALLRPQLERRVREIEALHQSDWLAALRAAGNGWRGVATVAFRVGHDSNLNSAPSRDTLTLTLPGVDAVLLLADRFRQRSGTAALFEATGQLARPFDGGGALHVYGEVRTRGSPSASDTNYQQAQAVIAWSQPLETGDALISAGATQLRYGGENLYHAERLAVGRDWALPMCRPRAGVETEFRRYPAAAQLEGRFTGLATGVTCVSGFNRVTLTARVGEDEAQSDRPGGDQRHGDVRINWLRPLAGGSLTTDVVLSRQQDDTGFSPILANHAPRRLTRGTLHVEYAYPLSTVWSVLASFDTTVQRSNLDLFDISGRAVYLGLRWQSR